VNVLVSHRDSGGAPVIYEDNPLYQNLVGYISHYIQVLHQELFHVFPALPHPFTISRIP